MQPRFLADEMPAKTAPARHSLRAPRFLADEMLAKLVRRMRIFGIPVSYVEGKSDEKILSLARRSHYFLLTSDEELAQRCKKRRIPALYLPQISADRQIALVLSHFRLHLPPFPTSSLCPKCGGRLIKAKKESLKGEIYPTVLKRRRLFWRCASCKHIYWSGTHYQRLYGAYWRIRRRHLG